MYGTFSGLSFGLVAIAILLVIALAVAASPLIAVIVAAVIGVFMLMGMSAMRRRSAAEDEPGGSAHRRQARGPSGRRGSGAPASGEG